MNIITQTPVTCYSALTNLLTAFGMMAVVCPLIIYIVKNRKRDKDKGAWYVLLGFAIGLILIFGSPALTSEETGRYVYECTFDDGITINNVTENYDIIGFADAIWTVEDKE